MAFASSNALLALHGLRLKGFADASVIGGLVGLEVEDVEAELKLAADAGHTVYRDGRRTGWALLPEGRTHNERLLAAELDEVGCRVSVQSAYESFLALNGQMLSVCTRWQVTDVEAQEINDHSDEIYDAAVIADLAALDQAVQPICADLATCLERFSHYGDRFTSALQKVQAGDTDWFTAPIKESYHTVWFELHEDLLASLGIDRASEKAHS